MSVQQPLPERLRPDDLNLFLGQSHLGERLRSLMQAKRLPSLLFFGPPGCGKSTLALLLAKGTGKKYLRLSAPEAGLQHLRRALTGVEVLVLDELHRFSKAQQDFFLPLVESGELTLLATTTENPSFSVTRQLLSRLHVLRLRPLGHAEMLELARRGAKDLGLELAEPVADLLAGGAHGDARTLLNLVEYVAVLPEDRRELEQVRAALPEILQRHDKDGDSHYELASALIKSIRGSDVDAALYYLACLLEGGEDPRFVCRRLILSASEDVGLADSRALEICVAAYQACHFLGMPECTVHLTHAAVYLSAAPKSNALYKAYETAKKDALEMLDEPVPLVIRNAPTRLMKELHYGEGYQYAHDAQDKLTDMQCLPDSLQGRHYYVPTEQGSEARVAERLAQIEAWRAAHRKPREKE